MKKNKILLLIVALTIFLKSVAHAIEILPDSYSFDKATDADTYQYHDWTGVQLIDGEYGVAPWQANLGNGHSYEWLGWVDDSPVNIDFQFNSPHLIQSINIGTVQDHINDVVIPDAEIFSSNDGISWTSLGSITTPESSSNNNSYRTLSFSGLNITETHVRVALSHNTNGPWTFIDEIDFFGVPDAGNILVLTGSCLLGLAALRRKLK